MVKIKQPTQLIKWGNDEVTPIELFRELDRIVADPVRNLYEMDGDMYLSDYRKLADAQWKIHSSYEIYKKREE
jgi:hypothetical protein